MPMLNARCDRCGTVFPSLISVGNGVFSALRFGKTGPCPRCGAMGSVIADGTEFHVENDRVIIDKGRLSQIDLALLASTLSSYAQEKQSKKNLQRIIVKALPQSAPHIRHLTRDQLLIIIIAIITFIQNQTNADSAGAQIDQLLGLVAEQSQQLQDTKHHLGQSRQHQHTTDPHQETRRKR